jgi:hypothetical protein
MAELVAFLGTNSSYRSLVVPVVVEVVVTPEILGQAEEQVAERF